MGLENVIERYAYRRYILYINVFAPKYIRILNAFDSTMDRWSGHLRQTPWKAITMRIRSCWLLLYLISAPNSRTWLYLMGIKKAHAKHMWYCIYSHITQGIRGMMMLWFSDNWLRWAHIKRDLSKLLLIVCLWVCLCVLCVWDDLWEACAARALIYQRFDVWPGPFYFDSHTDT